VLALGNGYVGPVPVPVIIAAVVGVIAHIVLTRTKLGRYVYAVGGNEEAARISGINVANIKLFVYGLSGALAAVSGTIMAARLYSGNPTAGQDTALDVIAAVVIGGTSLSGGAGSMLGTFVGVLFIGLLANGMTLMGVDPYWQEVARGLIVLVAVLISAARNVRRD
jgi:ribose transport system permease protein